jgi:hypothetical protein
MTVNDKSLESDDLMEGDPFEQIRRSAALEARNPKFDGL